MHALRLNGCRSGSFRPAAAVPGRWDSATVKAPHVANAAAIHRGQASCGLLSAVFSSRCMVLKQSGLRSLPPLLGAGAGRHCIAIAGALLFVATPSISALTPLGPALLQPQSPMLTSVWRGSPCLPHALRLIARRPTMHRRSYMPASRGPPSCAPQTAALPPDLCRAARAAFTSATAASARLPSTPEPLVLPAAT